MFDRYFPAMRGGGSPSRWRRSPQRVSVQWENELGAGLILSPRNFHTSGDDGAVSRPPSARRGSAGQTSCGGLDLAPGATLTVPIMHEELMTIGAFARSTGLSAKALRGYDELGLLRPASVDPVDAATHRRLAVELFNRSWRLLDLPRRTPEQDDELVHVVHASCHHWREIGSA